MNEFLDSLDRLVQLEEAQPQASGSTKKRQRVIEAGRLVLLENDVYNSSFLSPETVRRYEEMTELYIASLNGFSCEEVYQRANHVLAFHHFQSKKII